MGRRGSWLRLWSEPAFERWPISIRPATPLASSRPRWRTAAWSRSLGWWSLPWPALDPAVCSSYRCAQMKPGSWPPSSAVPASLAASEAASMTDAFAPKNTSTPTYQPLAHVAAVMPFEQWLGQALRDLLPALDPRETQAKADAIV